MKKQFLKNHVAIIITLMMFSLLPEFATAQTGKKNKCIFFCPNGYICVNGYCRRNMPFLTGGSPVNEAVSISSAISNADSLQLVQVQNIATKTIAKSGSLVNSADSKIPVKGIYMQKL